jgi:hypothetical protein
VPTAYRFEAVDGFSISLSANSGAYCSPRKDIWEIQLPYYNFLWTSKNSPPELERIHQPNYQVDLPNESFATVELGFPSGPVPQLKYFKEGEDPDKDSVFAYVPIIDFLDLMTDHGGIIQANWAYLPPMNTLHDSLEDENLSHIVKALDPSRWAGWDTINWQVIPTTFYAHGVSY